MDREQKIRTIFKPRLTNGPTTSSYMPVQKSLNGRSSFNSREDVILAKENICPTPTHTRKSIVQMRNNGAKNPARYVPCPTVKTVDALPGQIGARGRTGPDLAAEINSSKSKNQPLITESLRKNRAAALQAQTEIELLRKQLEQEAQMEMDNQRRVSRY